MDNELVSIITPMYNSARFVAETIESVLAQTYVNWEMIITDDCSSDNSCEIVERYMAGDPRVKLVRLEKNSGAAAARNSSLQAARGRYIAFLDSDDIWMPEKLQSHIDFMRRHACAFTFSAYSQIDEGGCDIGRDIRVPAYIDYRGLLCNTIIGCLTVVVDRRMTGDFSMPDIRTSQDTATWLLILRRGFVAYGIQKPLARYRLVGNSNSSKKWRAARDVWRVYRRIERLNFFLAAFCFCGYVFNAVKKRI